MRASLASVLRTGVGFVVGAVLVVAAAYGVSERLDPVYPELRARMAHFRQHAPAIDAVSVGNSHSRAIDFDALGVRGTHLWMGGQDVFEAAYLARYAADAAANIRYVLFPVSPGFQQVDHAVVRSVDERSRRRELYARTPLRRPVAGDGSLWVSGRLAPVVREDHWKGVAARLRGPRPPIRLTPHGLRTERPRAPLTPDSMARYGAGRGSAHRAAAEETVAVDPTTPRRVAAELDDLAGYLGARGVLLVLYTPPYHPGYLHEIPAAMMAETRSTTKRIVDRHRNVIWMDFSVHPAFSGRDELFMNADHLNREGARLLSDRLRHCIEELHGTRKWASAGRTTRGVAECRTDR
jgi:hypothetical protein